MKVDISFSRELDFFLSPDRAGKKVSIEFQGRRQVKDLIQSCGVPHTEVGEIRVNHCPVAFHYILQDGDEVEVGACLNQCPVPGEGFGFICDVHLWKLARRLRLLGFDTYFDSRLDDTALAGISQKENRILLTRDRGLLMRNIVSQGLYIRHTQTEQQVIEVLNRLNIAGLVHPFKRCLVCNSLLQEVEPGSEFFTVKLKPQVPPRILVWCEEYNYCPKCEKVYWPGTHYKNLTRRVEEYHRSLLFHANPPPPIKWPFL